MPPAGWNGCCCGEHRMTDATKAAAAQRRRLTRVTAAFGLGEVADVERVARGAMGAVWRVDLADGRRVAIKELFWERMSEPAAGDEVAFRDACAVAGVPSPAALRTPEGALLLPAQRDAAWRAYEWVDGAVPDRLDAATIGWLAEAMARMHRVDFVPQVEIDGRKTRWYYRVDADWSAVFDAVAAAGMAWADGLRSRKPDLVGLAELVNAAPVGEMRWCHRDLKNDNTIERSGSWFLVDWDNAGPMPPARELGLLLMDHIADDRALRLVTSGYRDAGGPAQIRQPDDFATGLAVWLNFLAVQIQVCLDEPPGTEHSEFAEDRVRGLIRDLPTARVIEAAAEVCAAATRVRQR